MKNIRILFLILLSLLFLILEILGFSSFSISIFKIRFSYILVLSVLVSFNYREIYKVLTICLINGLLIDIFNNFQSFYFINFLIMAIIVNNISQKISFSNIYLFIIISFSTFFIEILNATFIGFFYYGFDNNFVAYQIFKENIIPYILGNNFIGYIMNLFLKREN